jgi:hypothetical protein
VSSVRGYQVQRKLNKGKPVLSELQMTQFKTMIDYLALMPGSSSLKFDKTQPDINYLKINNYLQKNNWCVDELITFNIDTEGKNKSDCNYGNPHLITKIHVSYQLNYGLEDEILALFNKAYYTPIQQQVNGYLLKMLVDMGFYQHPNRLIYFLESEIEQFEEFEIEDDCDKCYYENRIEEANNTLAEVREMYDLMYTRLMSDLDFYLYMKSAKAKKHPLYEFIRTVGFLSANGFSLNDYLLSEQGFYRMEDGYGEGISPFSDYMVLFPTSGQTFLDRYAYFDENSFTEEFVIFTGVKTQDVLNKEKLTLYTNKVDRYPILAIVSAITAFRFGDIPGNNLSFQPLNEILKENGFTDQIYTTANIDLVSISRWTGIHRVSENK